MFDKFTRHDWIYFCRAVAKQKQYLSFDFNRHGIIAGEGSKNVHAAIAAFIDKV